MVVPTASPVSGMAALTVVPTREASAYAVAVALMAVPTAEPTVAQTAEPTVAQTAEPTVAQTAEPTVEPTVAQTAGPTVAQTAEPMVAQMAGLPAEA
jgi:hypothetical protein